MIKMIIAKRIKVVRSVSGTTRLVNGKIYTERFLAVGDIAIVKGEYIIGIIHADSFGMEIWNDNGQIVAPGARGECLAALPAAADILELRKDDIRTYFVHPNVPIPMWAWNREAAKFV